MYVDNDIYGIMKTPKLIKIKERAQRLVRDVDITTLIERLFTEEVLGLGHFFYG